MQSYYSNPHQLQAAVAAAAASSAGGGGGGGGGGTQRGLPFQSPFVGLHDAAAAVGRSPHLRGLHGAASENATVICGGSNSQRPSGSLDEINESEMDSDILSENEEDEDEEEIDAETKHDQSTTNQSKLKRKEEAEEEENGEENGEGDGGLRPSPQNLSSASKRLRESVDDDDEGGGGRREGGGGGGSGPDDEQTTRQTEIKVQRPLGLLAQHGLSMKTMAAAAAAALKTPHEFDHRNHHHHHHHHHERWERERRVSPAGHQDPSSDRGQLEGLDRREGKEEEELELEEEEGGLVTPGAGGLDFSGGGQMSLMHDRRFMPSPPPSMASPNGLDAHGKRPATPSGHHWTFEEQFKQLYEMSSELKRKEFLDDLFTFMQKRGTPVNRIPIMAKQTLDLYELFRLVVSKGGLVEVINKKLWREITKGLNLPSSITSAAFTLRTQYMKYLYPYECDRLKLSTLSELQSAIDGNRREGRRPGYGYDFSPIPTLLPTPPTPHLNGPLHPLASVRPPTGLSPKDDERSLQLQSGHHLRSLAEHDARAMEVATRAMEDLVNKRMDEVSRAAAIASSGVMTSNGVVMTSPIVNSAAAAAAAAVSKFDEMSAALKRPTTTMFEDDRFLAHMGMHNTHIKLNSRSNGRLEYDSSMVVTMEINGMMYQGVLFAQHPRRI